MEEAKENGTGGNGSLFVTTTAFNLKEHQENRTKIKKTHCQISFFLKNPNKPILTFEKFGKKTREIKVVPGNNCVLTNFLFEIAN